MLQFEVSIETIEYQMVIFRWVGSEISDFSKHTTSATSKRVFLKKRLFYALLLAIATCSISSNLSVPDQIVSLFEPFDTEASFFICPTVQGRPYLLARYEIVILSKCMPMIFKKKFLESKGLGVVNINIQCFIKSFSLASSLTTTHFGKTGY